MEDYVWHNGKKYRMGYTTGSCATAAAKVAALMILRQQTIANVSIVTPSGKTLNLAVRDASVQGQTATAAIEKDGGDDIDATHGMLIYARVVLNDSGDIRIGGGEGVGTVNRKGIGLPVGEAAINTTPRQTIEAAVRDVIGPQRGADVTIFAPEGQERAKKTYNGRLGIIGGISIIGTTGIVTPMSDESWKKSLSLELEMKRAQGMDKVILVPGNHGERFVQEQFHLRPEYVVTMSNFVGYMLKEAERMSYRRILLVGHFGKLVKVAAGIFHTHSHVADGRIETLLAHLALMEAPYALIKKVNDCATTEEAMELIDEAGLEAVYGHIADKIKQRVEQLFRFAPQPPVCDAILFSYDGKVLGASGDVTQLTEAFRD
jgi:cobalt-precorrin-5B (C1)-methyltransferase